MTMAMFGAAASSGLTGATDALARQLQQVLVAVKSRAGGGSGTVVGDGLVVTNHHVVPGGRAEVVTWDDRTFPAVVTARDSERDLALLQVKGAMGLTVAELGNSGELRVGELVFAIGNPWGQRGTLTAGVVFSRGPATLEAGLPLEDAICADVRLAPGNSGGPLVNARGQVVGINSMVAGGIAVAVPSRFVQALLNGDAPGQGFIGITGQVVPLPPAIAASYGGSEDAGILITGVEEFSPAAASGLYPGDVVVGINGSRGGIRATATALKRMRPGATVTLDLLRAGQVLTLEATPVERN